MLDRSPPHRGRSLRLTSVALLTLCLTLALPPRTSAAAEGTLSGLLRYPDVSATHIVFLYANDLWLVSRSGGEARPLASPPGEELFPKFSPDGSQLAFVGNYDAGRDLYVVPTEGGIPQRITHHPAGEVLNDWTPDGERLIFFASGLGTYPRARELFTVSADGGIPEKLPVPYGAQAAMEKADGWMAYTPNTRDQRTWKRYRGGMASDIWLFHLTSHESRRITDWEGTDTLPMWHGGVVYYLSDAGPEHRLNLWAYEVSSAERRQVTTFADYDVKWPSIGPGPSGQGEIVFQKGPGLYLLDLGSGETREVKVQVPGARSALRTQAVDAGEMIFERNISPHGKRAVINARGDIWTLPAKEGSPRNLTRTGGVAERDPSWSPDGQWIAYFSDADGEYQLYTRRSDGRGEAVRRTELEPGFYLSPIWSPDSKHIAFHDKSARYFLHTLESGETKAFDKDPDGFASRLRWSPDSAWITYSKAVESRLNAIWLYDAKQGTTHQLTSGRFNDGWPVFGRDGKYLYFTGQRDFTRPTYEDVGTTFAYAATGRLFAAPLRKDVPSPIAPESDEDGWGEDEGEDEEAEDEDAEDEDEPRSKKRRSGEKDRAEKMAKGKDKKDKVEPVEIDLEGFEGRIVQLPAEKGNFALLEVNDRGQLIYFRMAPRGTGGDAKVQLLDLDADKDEERFADLPDFLKAGARFGSGGPEKTVIDKNQGFAMSADGKRLLVIQERGMAIVRARPSQRADRMLAQRGLMTERDPRVEWGQIFDDAWRIFRDYFYDPGMHGVDWEAVREQYRPLLEACQTREDLSFVIREMISELNVGHAYYFGGDGEDAPRSNVGLLGADFELAEGVFRIARIYEGGPWDVDARGPLSQPGLEVSEGDFLLAVNGAPLDPSRDPWAAFQGMAGKTVTLTVGDSPRWDEDVRDLVVELVRSERDLRYWSWVEANRARVENLTDGKVGYIYVPNTGVEGQNHLFRQFYGQVQKQALIIDERWNGGGQIPTRFVELLNRPAVNYWAWRGGRDWSWPPDSHFGPKCMLINGLAGSGGDYFPYWFREAGVGKLIGTRTWGGLVGISGNPPLIDGGAVAVPTFGFYESDGTWGIEGHGVDPDIEVIDDPAKMVDGGDPQLEAAIEHMLEEIERNPYKAPTPPAFPDRRGMGLPEADY